jgi:hypothetical protein
MINGEEALTLFLGTTIGFCWLPMRIVMKRRPEGTLARSALKKGSLSERSVAIPLGILCAVPAFMAITSLAIMSPIEPGIYFLIPATVGPVVWLLVVLIFGQAFPSKLFRNPIIEAYYKSIENNPSRSVSKAMTVSKRVARLLEETKEPNLKNPSANIDWVREEKIIVAINKIVEPRAIFAIDGNNIALIGSQKPDISIVRDLTSYLLNQGHEVRVFFDANIGYLLTEGRAGLSNSELSEAFGLSEEIVSRVPGGTQADEWILRFASEENAFIISNDLFRDYEAEFPFIKDKGRLRSAIKIGDRVLVRDFEESILVGEQRN